MIGAPMDAKYGCAALNQGVSLWRMSQLQASPFFEACCGSAAASTPTANPVVYYDSASTSGATPAAQGLVPQFLNLPATAFDINGTGSVYIWNPATSKWV